MIIYVIPHSDVVILIRLDVDKLVSEGREREREGRGESIAALDYAAMTAAESKTGFGMVRVRERGKGLMSDL